jgi:SAM-dependent methyltransferase
MAAHTSLSDIPHTRINAVRFFLSWINDQPPGALAGRHVYDLSCGSGYIANLFHQAGATVFAYDLFPQQCAYPHLNCRHIDLQQKLPLPDAVADVVICSETIECIPDQNQLFAELSRILKPAGALLLTTANPSSLRSRFAQFIQESEHYAVPLPNETNALVKWPGEESGYFSKLFISGVLRIRTLAALHGLCIARIYRSRPSSTSLLLLFLYPLIWFFSWKACRKGIRQEPHLRAVHREVFAVNTSFRILTGKHLAIAFQKLNQA